MNIEYKLNAELTVDQFKRLLDESKLGERRPVDDRACLEGMLKNSNLVVSAWDGEKLVGIARSITDFHYACYLSDLAVSEEYKRKGIGKKLQTVTQEQLDPNCKLILVAAPSANSYYEHLGFSNNPRCWVLGRGEKIKE